MTFKTSSCNFSILKLESVLYVHCQLSKLVIIEPGKIQLCNNVSIVENYLVVKMGLHF